MRLPPLELPIIDRNPPSDRSDLAISNLVIRLRKISGLTQIYGGYNKITNPVNTPLERFGNTTILGFDVEEINTYVRDKGGILLCYIAFPINDMDDLTESPNLSDWDFEENYLKKIINTKTVPVGAIRCNNDSVKLRTINFLMLDEEQKGKKLPNKSGNCFIATAAYGSPYSNEVLILKKWRDGILLKTYLGIKLVKFYYFCSPPLAKIISNNDFLKLIIIKLLKSVIKLLK